MKGEEELQKELFEEFEDRKRRFKMPRGFLTRPTYISIPLERLVFIGIGVVMALVIAHASGVERGKMSARSELKKMKGQRSAPAYTILIGVFKERASLDAIASQLRREGYDTFVSSQGEHLQLYAGRFTTVADAARAQALLKKRYKDCVIKKFQGG